VHSPLLFHEGSEDRGLTEQQLFFIETFLSKFGEQKRKGVVGIPSISLFLLPLWVTDQLIIGFIVAF